MLLVSVFASDQPDTTESGCTAIAIVLHLTVILQFAWILALVSSFSTLTTCCASYLHIHALYIWCFPLP